jgi:PAS domain S-box-containing protein
MPQDHSLHLLERQGFLPDTDERIRFVLEACRIGVWEVDLTTNKLFSSPVINNIFGYEGLHHEWTYEESVKHFHPGDLEYITAKFNKAVETSGEWDIECRIFTIGGHTRWVRISGRYTQNGSPRMTGFLQDISEIKNAQQKIKDNEEPFRQLFQDHTAVNLIVDPKDGNIVNANEAAARFYGWSTDELTNMNFSRINSLSIEEMKEVLESIKSTVNKCFHFKNINANGEIRYVEAFCSKIKTDDRDYRHFIIHDITDKIRAEDHLKLLSSSVKQSPVSTVITDTNGHIMYVNPAFIKTTGYTFEEIKGKNLRILKSGHQSPEFYKVLWETILSGREWKGEFINKKKNGELYWEKTVISPIHNKNGDITHFVAITEDITEIKKMVDDLNVAKKAAEESDRLKSAFLANISHEIRTPMNGILGFTKILKDPGLTGHQHQEYVDIIHNSGKRMLDTVNDLIDISKIETGQVTLNISEVNLKDEFEEIFNFFLPQAEKKGLKFTMNNRLPSGATMVKTDKTKLVSILTNLIKNAIKFTGKGKIETGCRYKSRSIEFYVRDSGIGIPPEKQSAVFNRFEQVDLEDANIFQGTGLGLAIVKAYVEMLDGRIWLESKERSGSTFYFTIPITGPDFDESGEPETEHSDKPDIPRLPGRKILISEDDFYSREILVYLLKKTGATLVLAKDGKETIRQYEDNDIDLVLLDIRLPEMDGYEVIKHLRSKDPELLVIAQTAFALMDDIRRFQEAGFTDYMTKPIGPEELYNLLRKYLCQPPGVY